MFGESDNDRKALAELIQGLCPKVAVRCVREPLVLVKGAKPENVPSHARKVALAAKAAAAKETVRCVFAHQDADAVEPAHAAVAQTIESALTREGCPGQIHAVVPAWEIESWWFLWPDVVAGLHKSWRRPKAPGSVGNIADAKQALNAALKPTARRGERSRAPDYRESDSIEIARRIRIAGLAQSPAPGASASYDRFRKSVGRCCEAEAA